MTSSTNTPPPRHLEFQARFLSSLDSTTLKKFLKEYAIYMQLYQQMQKRYQQQQQQDGTDASVDNDLRQQMQESYESLQEIIQDLNFEMACTAQKDSFTRQQDLEYLRERDESIQREITEAEMQVQQLQAQLKRQEEKKRNKLEYDVLAEKILSFGDRDALERELRELEQEKEAQLEKGRKLDEESDLRTKQYQLINHALSQLEKDLEER